MNDRQNPYGHDPYYQQPQIIGYDEYGQPVYQQHGQEQGGQPYDPYAAQQGQSQGQGHVTDTGYGYDPYNQSQQSQQPQAQPYDPYAAQHQQPHQNQSGTDQGYVQGQGQGQSQAQGYGYGGYTDYGYATGQQPAAVDTGQWNIPQQGTAPAPEQAPQHAPQQEQPAARPASERGADRASEGGSGPLPDAESEADPAVPGQRRPAPDYRTEQFSFIEEPDEDSEDVIDWLKFTESRSERREEARRKGRNRMIALIVVAVLVVVGGVGYLWSADLIPGLSGKEEKKTVAAGAQQRDVIVVHLHNTKKGGTSTALLVDNVTTKQGTTVLLPNTLAVAGDDGSTITLGKSVDDDGRSGTREAVETLLGTKISGTWRLDTPYLEILVEQVGNIEMDTDIDVPDAKKGADPLVKKGEAQTLSGPMAVAYATYLAPGEAEAKQLTRFGEVMRAVLRKISEDPKAATVTVETLAQVLDPSLPEKDLGASLAKLASRAKIGDYKTMLLPVQDDGTLTDAATRSVVKDVLGGTVKAPEEGAPLRVAVRNATGNTKAAESARITLVNGGYAFVDSGKADDEAESVVIYRSAEDKEKATEVAKTLGLSAGAVKQGEPAANADVSAVLGQNYKIK
ncbi:MULTISPECIES: LCP family protein [Streptomyces]|uniref:LCP family protein n=1 Tax=Streptomyces TaxID=1883 RepID=UPI00103EAC23|nr:MULTISPECIES: LCP family protein [Streptomyces]MBT3073713.1 LytR C-terminal domain-containing protein [Streptomyces sp. COG21]MBT3083626.1 LytR C-terminal domain-containing protein [Streptomyces sp. COG20]MBT3086210.1 LytR C-terminal domain-containing protein [Streptomyces sp. CYG21]MBT3100105.1 LytR C-terminal domain-containing protein [Streptomyces sp. CBG30]MBT3101734.1 LytR C-terminal domain-containing protein [Streptomyces sp. COG19]